MGWYGQFDGSVQTAFDTTVPGSVFAAANSFTVCYWIKPPSVGYDSMCE